MHDPIVQKAVSEMAAPNGKDHIVHRANDTAHIECVWKRVDRPL